MVTRWLRELGSTWPPPQVVEVTSSTQAEAAAELAAGRPVPFAVVAERQTHGRGRLDRHWVAPPNSSILCSVVVPQGHFPDPVPLVVGVLLVRELQRWEPALRLKWPNDLVLPTREGLRKLGGIIAEVDQVHGAIIVGFGINVQLGDEELPTTEAISLLQCGVRVAREELLTRLLSALESPTAVDLGTYRALCCTIGAEVVVHTPSGELVSGSVVDVNDTGALLVRDAQGVRAFLAGDVVHVRSGA